MPSAVTTGARVALALAAAAEGAAALERLAARRRSFAAASRRAAETGRRLVVVGNPDGGAHTRLVRAYGCGDVCLDLDGCPSCPSAEAVDLSSGAPSSVAADSAVVYVSCVLEYVPDPRAAARELMRMAGSADNLFVVAVQPWSATAALYPGAVSTVDPLTLASAPVGFARKAATVAALAALVALAAGAADPPGA